MGAVLIVMAFAFGGFGDGGASSSVVKIRMTTMADCQAAKQRVERRGSVGETANGAGVGVWHVEAVCVEGD